MLPENKLKLSELPDDELITYEDAYVTYTVAELKREILELSEPHHKRTNWCIAIPDKWVPSASGMIERHIEDSQDEMYEDWEEQATDCIDEEVVAKIQVLLEEMFANASDYWRYGKGVEIDIFPPMKEGESHE